MNLVVIGAGYVGLVSGACFAELGHNVICVDTDDRRISALKNGESPIYEPGLSDLIAGNSAEGRLSFSTDCAGPVSQADVVFIAVGTPSSRRGDGYADLSYVYGAATDIASCLSGYTVIVDKSTVPVGTARQVHSTIHDVNPNADFDVVSNPEFLREGAAIPDFMRPDRIVVGADSERAAETMRRLYEPLCLDGSSLLVTSLESAELIKYSSNAFLALKISFINEVANLCETVGADVLEVARGIGQDRRIGASFLKPGPGYGGSCFPKDAKALLRVAQEHGASLRIMESAVEVNEAQKARMVLKIRKALGGSERGKTVGVLGLSFKPDTDDMRDAPALSIIPRLQEHGARVKAHDPASMDVASPLLPGVQLVSSALEVGDGADVVVLMTEWNEYCELDLCELKSRMKSSAFVDLRNLYDPIKMAGLGFDYVSVGRGARK
jgi:UDPglucose 6-dehydrogenase